MISCSRHSAIVIFKYNLLETFLLNFSRSYGFQLTISRHCSMQVVTWYRMGRHAITWANDDRINWHIYPKPLSVKRLTHQEQRNRRVAGFSTSFGHCLFNGCNLNIVWYDACYGILLSLKGQHGGCWWSGTYLVPGLLQPSHDDVGWSVYRVPNLMSVTNV